MKRKILLFASSCLLASTVVTAQQRVPLFENFTSSTCPPCKNGNIKFEGVVTTKPANDYVSIKYQQDFPGAGDPYATAEGVGRRDSYLGYYINSVPRMQIDGGWNGNSGSFSEALYTAARAVPANFNLTGTFTFNSATKQMTAKVKYAPLSASVATGAVLYVAIIEKETVLNVKNNGETKFENVLKKMMPSMAGTPLTGLAVGKTDSMTLSFTFAGAFRLPANGQSGSHINDATEHSVEHFENLRVVAWVQNGATSTATTLATPRTVYQAANLEQRFVTDVKEVGAGAVTSVTVYPNPANAQLNVKFNMNKADAVSAHLADMNGAIVATKMVDMQAGENQVSFDTQALAAGIYNLMIFDSKSNFIGQQVVVRH